MNQNTVFWTPSEVAETSTYKKIRRLLQGTAKLSQFSFMFGPTGRGKTFAARDWLSKYENGAYVRAETGSTQAKLRRNLSQAIFDGDDSARERDIYDYIRKHPGFVLIVDECNHLIAKADRAGANNLDSIRDYYDRIQDAGGQFGVCFIFTNYTLERLRQCRLASFLEQFISRVDNHLNIPAKISRAYEIAPIVTRLVPEADNALIDAAASINNVRAICKRIAVLKEYSAKFKTPITAQMLLDTHEQIRSGDYRDEQEEREG